MAHDILETIRRRPPHRRLQCWLARPLGAFRRVNCGAFLHVAQSFEDLVMTVMLVASGKIGTYASCLMELSCRWLGGDFHYDPFVQKILFTKDYSAVFRVFRCRQTGSPQGTHQN